MIRDRIARALAGLVRDGLLSSEQSVAVEERLVDEFIAPSTTSGRLSSLVGILGAVLVGAGIVYLVAYNWDDLGKGVKLATLFGTLFALHHFGFTLAERPGKYLRTGRALTSLGNITAGACIFLVAQIYHLQSDYPHAMLFWWLACLPFVFLTRSPIDLLLTVVLAVIWLAWQTAAWFDLADPFQAYRGPDHQVYLGSFAFLACSTGVLFEVFASVARASGWRVAYKILRSFAWPLLLLGVFIVGVHEMWRNEPSGALPMGMLRPGLWLLAVAALVAVAARLWRLWEAPSRDLQMMLVGVVGVAVLFATAYGWTTVPANLLLLALLVGLITLGVQRQSAFRVNIGILYFLLAVLARYIEHLADRLSGGLAFIGAGLLLLLLGGGLERQRRRWLAQRSSR